MVELNKPSTETKQPRRFGNWLVTWSTGTRAEAGSGYAACMRTEDGEEEI
jgi:hypothetical protein